MCAGNVLVLSFLIGLRIQRGVGILTDFYDCHDDFTLKPHDGILDVFTFKWVGFVQYLHVTTSIPHHSKAPRVTLIHKQYTIGTAKDLMQLPRNYKLGNVIFGEYEREEFDCGLTKNMIRLGRRCGRAYLDVPIESATAHPEYSRFGVGNSLVLVKLLRPMKSHYMLPICLPSLNERKRKKRNKIVYLIDYMSSVPKDFDAERMGKKTLKLFTHAECRRHRMKSRLTSEGVTHVLCTSGCGVRSGAPIVTHNLNGAFELIGVAAAGGECSKKAMRNRLIKEPPLYIDVYPYITWIVNVVTANEMPSAIPRTFKLTHSGNQMSLRRSNTAERQGWRGRAYVSGNSCYKSSKQQRATAFFYSETFDVTADPPAKVTINMMIAAGIDCTIVCARLVLPNRLSTPKIEGVGRYNISIAMSTEWFPYKFTYSLGLNGVNTTEENRNEWMLENDPKYHFL